jgi:SAM-dependent methyltransferase
VIENLDKALSRAQEVLAIPESIRRICISGRAKGRQPEQVRIDIRPVVLKSGLHWQVVSHDGKRDTTKNLALNELSLAKLFEVGYANILIESTSQEISIRLTKSGDAQLSTKRVELDAAELSHDRSKERLLSADDEIFIELGISDHNGKLKPSRSDKFIQVQEFLKILSHSLDEKRDKSQELKVIDLGCGHAYLTLAAHKYLINQGYKVKTLGIDERQESRERNIALVDKLKMSKEITFQATKIAKLELTKADIAIALHACDTASDDAISWAVKSGVEMILVAPCCHHDIQRQMKHSPASWNIATKHGIINQRVGDILTDSIRAAVLKILGYRTDIIEFVAGEHTPRNLMIRAFKTGAPAQRADIEELEQIIAQWKIEPALMVRLKDELSVRLG